MRGDLNRLWDALTPLPGGCPMPEAKQIRRRVRAALDADPEERRLYMKQRMRFAVSLAAALVLLGGSALAVAGNWNVLNAFFEGDTSAAQGLVDEQARSVSDGSFTLTVSSSASDGQTAYLLATVTGETPEAVETLMAEDFENMDTWNYDRIETETDDPPAESGGPIIMSLGAGEEEQLRTENSRTWALDMGVTEHTTAIQLWLGVMGREWTLEIPLSQVQSVTVDVHASGEGVPTVFNASGGTLTVEQVTLSPFTCSFRVSWWKEAEPLVFFRMADGSLRTTGQMMHFTDGDRIGESEDGYLFDWNYEFHQVQDLEQIRGIILFGREYPLDGSEPFDVTVDEKLYPFQIPLMDRLSEDSGYGVPVRALCEGLGGTCVWDNATKTAVCTYRDVTIALTLGSGTALVNGEPVALENPPANQDGSLAVNCGVFLDAWQIQMAAVADESGSEHVAWVVTP